MDVILPSTLPALNQAIFHRAQLDIPQFEDPPSSNRSPYLDGLCRKWGVPLASYWCALQTAEIWADAGAETPPIGPKAHPAWHPAIAQVWYEWALETGRFSHEAVIGAAVLYGDNGRAPAHHIGACVASLTPYLTDFEGNSRLPWARAWTRNGECFALQPIDTDRLIGYVHPLPWSGGRL